MKQKQRGNFELKMTWREKKGLHILKRNVKR